MHYLERVRNTQAFLAGGPCVRCHKPRGFDKQAFKGQGESSLCLTCYNRLARLKARGTPEPTVEEDAKARAGCANCGLAEWSRARGTLCFHGFGEDRRCDGCFFYRAGNDGVERPREERGNNPAAQGMDGCQNPRCGVPETTPIKFHGLGPYRRCRRCYDTVSATGRERTPRSNGSTGPKGRNLRPEEKMGCQNPNCLLPESANTKGNFTGGGPNRRCLACRTYKSRNEDRERPAELFIAKVKDGCKNPHCMKPEPESKKEAQNFRGDGDDRRCNACRLWLKKHHVERGAVVDISGDGDGG
ncbi:hypothetical protein C8A01DRAFT_20994 [Parachaetomium inaequale]|uniref:Uncharacterized protein n=1 Tax=Parachaetomium inaequale TaxID=2588326 RepID=A0AAN6P8R3_9PEZI|nr:hypothetical protein C8A01DRAFT_20994 [Parachaetomium inaequale]